MSRALVYGGSGALGRAIVSRFRSANWHVISLDFSENPEASANIVLSLPGRAPSLADSGETVTARVAEALGNHKLDAILTVAGGWAGGNLADSSLFANTDAMISQSIHSSVIAARLAALHLKEYVSLLPLLLFRPGCGLQARVCDLPANDQLLPWTCAAAAS
nr:hypothetical protein HK105_003297 [Polyrhizophydium stewartii]